MKVSLGADHAGFPYKQLVHDAITALGHEVIDCGTHSTDPVDFPDITAATCIPVLDGRADRAILVCGSGAGAIMAANKIHGIRCGLANEPYSAHQAVEHDDANAIALGAWLAPRAFIGEIVANFLNATFDDDEDTRRRVAKLNALDDRTAPLVPVLT
ncbi:RpiB/LacA/LacB family sugar-phosphate isomerase [Mycetocola miduiensis]|uniref:Ribose 5-phosphate isomerase B n=1 Tax=Mycetocola miduiensis TaxID=995034 RepID=A0A1I4ZN97_9MICO|nr:RpiB/LacA/LacB family sugar-phosphate isomerase [Mycetocola miduiensis]SFN51667.1 ribose 5-phosphate isomerase B [Mycetocola miduiensis]